jgi:hypothetical protein
VVQRASDLLAFTLVEPPADPDIIDPPVPVLTPGCAQAVKASMEINRDVF